uniref:Uncharacterized protein n=1 Tax=Musa acuminata subsp. malaccensis TaxID=214687 RepID=A0A804JV36_MUSAM
MDRELLEAATSGDVKYVQDARGTLVSKVTVNGNSVLHIAAKLGLLELAEAVCRKEFSLLRYNKNEHEDATKSTPFHFAAAHGDTRMVQLLLRSKPSAAYVQDEDGFSAIHVAASAGHPKIIQELLRHCPDFMEHKHNKGRNFLRVTIEKKKLEVVNLLFFSSFFILYFAPFLLLPKGCCPGFFMSSWSFLKPTKGRLQAI